MPPENQNQEKDLYDFILETEEPAEDKPLLKRISKKQKIIIITVFGLLLALASVTLISLNNRANALQKERLLSVAQTQVEIIRIASLGEKQTDSYTKERAAGIRGSIEADLEEVEVLLEARKAKLDEQTLSEKKNSQNDSKLVESILSNQFDQTFSELMDDLLFEYQRLLLEAQQKANSREKQALQEAYEKTDKLLGLSDEQQ